MGNSVYSIPSDISFPDAAGLQAVIRNQNTELLDQFDVLSYDGKKLMIDSMTESVEKYSDYEPRLFLNSLCTSGKLEEELLDRLQTGTREAYEYYSKLKNVRTHRDDAYSSPNVPDSTDNMDYPRRFNHVNEIINNAEKTASALDDLDDAEKEKRIDAVTKDFVRYGRFDDYMIIRSVSWRGMKYSKKLADKIGNLMNEAVTARKKRLLAE